MCSDVVYLYEHLPQTRHDIGRVLGTEPSDHADGALPDLKGLVVEGNEQGTEVLSLGQVGVKPLIQGGQHAVADVSVCGGGRGADGKCHFSLDKVTLISFFHFEN